MYHLQALYRLQTLETSLDSAKARKQAIEEELSSNVTLQAAQEYFNQHAEAYRQAESALNDLQLKQKGLDERLHENQDLLYSNKVSNPRELQEREAEIESLKRRQTRLSDELQTVQAQKNEANSMLEEAREALEQTRQDVENENAALLQEHAELVDNMQKWLQQRKKTLKNMDDTHHKIYKRLKKQKGGIAVARLDGKDCAVCRVEQYQNIIHQLRQGEDIVYCHNCGRILVEV